MYWPIPLISTSLHTFTHDHDFSIIVFQWYERILAFCSTWRCCPKAFSRFDFLGIPFLSTGSSQLGVVWQGRVLIILRSVLRREKPSISVCNIIVVDVEIRIAQQVDIQLLLAVAITPALTIVATSIQCRFYEGSSLLRIWDSPLLDKLSEIATKEIIPIAN